MAAVNNDQVVAHAPGRVCVLGEHTDYNEGLALSFAIAQGVTVRAQRIAPAGGGEERMLAAALDLGEQDEFPLADFGRPGQLSGWRAFVRGMVAELTRAGLPPVSSSVQIQGDLPRGGGLASSAALEVALALALLALAGRGTRIGRTRLGELCSRVENEWFGAHTGLLDQVSSLYGEPGMGLRIDFRTLFVTPVALTLDGWRFVTLDSGEQRTNASSGYNRRRAECAQACELLGIPSLRALGDRPRSERERRLAELPADLRRRARHVLSEDERVEKAVAALAAGDLPALGALLNEAHDSLRDDMEISTPTLDATVARMREAGAAGARLLGGGFGGSVLALMPPDVPAPAGAREAQPCGGARVVEGHYEAPPHTGR